MPGMVNVHGLRAVEVDDDGYTIGYYAKKNYAVELDVDSEPDFTDPATLGCILALVREVWGDPRIGVRGHLAEYGNPLYYAVEPLDVEVSGDTEAEALIAALEAKSDG
jgi:hypothetical protein